MNETKEIKNIISILVDVIVFKKKKIEDYNDSDLLVQFYKSAKNFIDKFKECIKEHKLINPGKFKYDYDYTFIIIIEAIVCLYYSNDKRFSKKIIQYDKFLGNGCFNVVFRVRIDNKQTEVFTSVLRVCYPCISKGRASSKQLKEHNKIYKYFNKHLSIYGDKIKNCNNFVDILCSCNSKERLNNYLVSYWMIVKEYKSIQLKNIKNEYLFYYFISLINIATKIYEIDYIYMDWKYLNVMLDEDLSNKYKYPIFVLTDIELHPITSTNYIKGHNISGFGDFHKDRMKIETYNKYLSNLIIIKEIYTIRKCNSVDSYFKLMKSPISIIELTEFMIELIDELETKIKNKLNHEHYELLLKFLCMTFSLIILV